MPPAAGKGPLYGKFSYAVPGNTVGRTPAAVAAIRRANERLARQLQAMAVANQQETLVRRGVDTGRLNRTLRNDRNRFVADDGFGVGMLAYLNRSAAKYWRQIEEGTDVHVGRRIRGVWSDTTYQSGRRVLTGGPYSPFGPPRSQKLRPIGRQGAYSLLAAEGYDVTSGRRPRVAGVIARPIEPQFYFRRAWDEFHPAERIVAEYRKELRAVGLVLVAPSNRSGGFYARGLPGRP